ncbi:MAG TPA: hypothetical protein VMA95_09000 [Streptosporangiaceae bacterium]|nr:hypothetical protein [Streptosporangiaceae bacterium]
MHEHTAGPSYGGTVVLELGPGIGALLLHTPPDLDGAEIEISQAGKEGVSRTHSQVRPRHTASGTKYAAVYPGLAEGQYTIWRDKHTKALDIAVAGGSVAIAWWPGD